MTDRFRQLVEKNIGCVVLLAGSGSDEPHLAKIIGEERKSGLRFYGTPHEVRVQSAHNDPKAILALLEHYDGMRGALAYITIAGGTDTLSGIVARHSIRPVISCPPDVPNDSCLTNPPLSSNMYVRHPRNAARAVAQLFSHLNNIYIERLEQDITEKAIDLDEIDEVLRTRLSWLPEGEEQ